MKMSCDEIAFHPLSFIDPNGRLFCWNGDLYRAIAVERVPFYRELFDQGVVQELIEKKLIVETQSSPLQLDGYGMVMKHKTIPFVSYPYEWCAAMLKDAALLVLDLELELAQTGLTLQDAYSWNVLYDGPIPVHVDLGSIGPVAQQDIFWGAYDEFCRFFLNPLLVMGQGYGRIARWLLHDYNEGISESDLSAFIGHSRWLFKAKSSREYAKSIAKKLIPGSYHSSLKKTLSLAKSRRWRFRNYPKDRLTYLRGLRRRIEGIETAKTKSDWSRYYDGWFPTFSPSSDWTHKHFSVSQVLSEIRPISVLDIGSNRGWYSQLAAITGSKVVAFDTDEACITQLYHAAREKHLSILPLVIDFRNPSPGYGLCNQSLAPATDRLRCEMVFALALVHHLVFKQNLNFDQIVDALSVFSQRWLLVEFIPADDICVREWWSEKFSWYTRDNFLAAVQKKFQNVRTLPSYPVPRVLVVGEKTQIG